MVSQKRSLKQKADAPKSGSLDAYISTKKASCATNPSENELDAPNMSVSGLEGSASTPIDPQPSKRKRADNDVKPQKRVHREDSTGGKRRQPKGYAPPSTYSHLPPLTDTIIPNLLCVFVGLNPGIQTATKGHPYAHPSNLYWPLLHSSGLTPDRRLAPSEYITLPEKYLLGNTNIVSRATKDGSQLSKEEMVEGAAVLDEKMRKWKPEIVCLVGKSIWEAVWKRKHRRAISKEDFRYGIHDPRQNMASTHKRRSAGFFGGKKEVRKTAEDDEDSEERWDGARVFVATSTSGLAASLSLSEKQKIWAELGESVQKRREEREQAKGELKAVESEGVNDLTES